MIKHKPSKLLTLLTCTLVFNLVVIFNTLVHAQNFSEKDNPCSSANMKTDIRPDHDGPPTKISTAIVMLDLMEICDISQTLNGDFAVILMWTDPRLAHLDGTVRV